MSYSRLSKLQLPTFDGNSLQWQIFWDSFLRSSGPQRLFDRSVEIQLSVYSTTRGCIPCY